MLVNSNFLLAILTTLISISVCKDKKESRQISVNWNPGCNVPECGSEQNGSYVNIIYVKAVGNKDIIHYVYSTYQSFTILVLKTDLKGELEIDWENFFKNDTSSIQVKGSAIMEKGGYVLPNIYEFNDKNGKADMKKIPSNSTFWKTYKTIDDLTWEKFTDYPGALGVLEGKVNSLNKTMNSTSNSFKFIIRNRGTESRDKVLPHLLVDTDSSTVDLVLDLPATWHDSKFAAEFLYMSSGDDYKIETKSTMDDEYTPGTFKIWNVQFSKKGNEKTDQTFFQCKPIFYYYEPRALENSTLALKYDLEPVSKAFDTELLYGALFGNNPTIYGMNVSFGIEGAYKDAFFHSQTNYTVWSFALGIGTAPVAKMSFVVTLVIAVGFGLPAFIIVAGVFFMIVKKIRGSRRSEFEPLN